MIERIIENWLINSAEKTFQIPFCYILANEGYTVIHLTRHCGMEHGKDVIAISPSGEVCAYQLKGAKGGKIKLKQYQEELLSQIMQLVHTPVAHPSVPFPNTHQSFFVTNGEIEEEVFRELDSFNKNWVLQGQPQYQVKTIVKGQLLQKALNLKTDLFPTEIKDFRSLIDFYLNDGRGVLDKNRFCKLIEGHFEKELSGETEAKRIISSGALLCSLATASFTNQNNHVAVVEAWTIFLSYLFWFAECHSLSLSTYRNESAIAEETIRNSLESLLEELSERKNYLEGSIPEDAFVYRYRITWLIGMISYLGIYYRVRGIDGIDENLDAIKNFTQANADKQQLWGESAIPCLIMQFWLRDAYGLSNSSMLLKDAIDGILIIQSKMDMPFTSPYEDIENSLSFLFTDDRLNVKLKLLRKESYYLWSLILLLTNKNEKAYLQSRWREISTFRFKAFQPINATDVFRWRNQDGKEVTTRPNTPESWSNLVAHSQLIEDKFIPKLLKQHKWFYPLFLLVFPHRIDKNLIMEFNSTLAIQ